MPLKSMLFAGNARLQSCLVQDASHVTPGSSGEHVALIQAALVRFRFLEPADAFAEAGRYGKATAAAVLGYKRVFNIVNHAYQNTADNIVGKMTIASLDTNMLALESVRFVAEPLRLAGDSHAVLQTGRSAPVHAFTSTAKTAVTAPVKAPTGATPTFDPPLSGLPRDMQETIWRSNLAKVKGTPSMYPFVGNHEEPLDAAELSRRFKDFKTSRDCMMELYNRMLPFKIWGLVKTIQAIYFGTGAKGMFCHPFDHAVSFSHMQALSTGPVRPRSPVLNDVTQAFEVMESPFCKDAFNVHGERDSWREIVKSGPGLHICVTNASGRARTDENYPASGFHIDEIQQGQFCSDGVCIPLMNGQTIGHLKTVGPWLLKQPGEWLRKKLPF